MVGVGLFLVYLIVGCLIIYFVRSSKLRKWWIKIVTQSPACTYYFGPFDSVEEAELHQVDYLEDLQQEGAQGIATSISRCQPRQLTIFEEDAEPIADVS